jgi:hypothetical protein
VFDTVLGLPVHVLVVHGVVVLLPVMTVVTTVWAFLPRSPRLVGWGVVAANAAVSVLTFLAKEIADVLPFFAFALLFASVLVQALRDRDVWVPDRLPAMLTALVALVALVWTVRAGHSGSQAVWSGIVRQTGG